MFEGERRDTAMNHLFFPSWHLLCGQGQQDIKAFSCWNTKTCIDLLLSFKVTWDHFASLSVTQPSKHRPGEACPTCLPLPAHTGYSSDPFFSLTGPSPVFPLFLMFFFFSLLGLLPFASALLAPVVWEFSLCHAFLCQAVGHRCMGFSPGGVSLEVCSAAESLATSKSSEGFH